MDDEDGPGRDVEGAPAWRRPLGEWLAATPYLAAMLIAQLAQTLAILAASACVFLRTSGRRRMRREKAWR